MRWLYLGRGVRSFATAFLTVVFPLYLAQRHDSATTVGVILTLGSVLGAGLMAAVGLVGDRIGRRPTLIAVGALGVVGALGLALSANLVVVIVASGLGGIGRGGGAGGGGAFGPFFPAEQPLLAGSVPPSERTRAFGRMGFIGVLAAAAGSLVAGAPTLLHHLGVSWDDAYRLVFTFGALASLVVVVVSIPLRERRPAPSRSSWRPSTSTPLRERRPRTRRSAAQRGLASRVPIADVSLPTTAASSPSPASSPPPSSSPSPASSLSAPTGLSTRQLIGRFGFTNALNGFGFGFLGPLLTYWFHVRFGVGPAEVGVLYAIANLVSAIPYLAGHRLSDRFGAVQTVVVTRAASVVALLAMAFVPDFVLAGLLLNLRTAFNSLGMPARQSYAMGAAEEGRRGTVAALGALPSMVTSSASPVIGGALMGAFVDIPIIGATVFMAANVATYYLAFRHAPLPGERARRVT